MHDPNSYSLTAQRVFNGEGFDPHFFYQKCWRELDRAKSCTTDFDALDHIFNFAVSVAATREWIKHSNKKSLCTPNEGPIQNRSNSAIGCNEAIDVLVDLANEYKHANRRYPSKHLQRLQRNFQITNHPQSADAMAPGRIFVSRLADDKFLHVHLLVNLPNKTLYFLDVAEIALECLRYHLDNQQSE